MASIYKRQKTYYLKYYVTGDPKPRRRSLHTQSYQIAKEKQRHFESAQFRGDDNPLPTRTGMPDILSRYVQLIRALKTAKSAQTDVYYLRQVFGPVCHELKVNSRKQSIKAMKRPPKPGQDRRIKPAVLEVNHLEQITTADIARFISDHVRSRGLAPKTANRYREILHRFFNWSMTEGGVKMPGDKNPVTAVARYKEKTPHIQFLTLKQVDEQLDALEDFPQLQAMVAMYIYAGLRREELLWLQTDDIDLQAANYGMIRIRAKTVAGEFWEPKTKVNRAVPISSSLRYYLDRYRQRLSPENWLFPSPQGFNLYDPDNFSRDLRNANHKASLKWTCLIYRHTFGSLLAQKGEDLYKISSLMGNSPEICRRHYAALIPEKLADCVEFTIKYSELILRKNII